MSIDISEQQLSELGRRRGRTRWVAVAAVVAVMAVMAVGGSRMSRGPRFIPAITVVNPTPYSLQVDVQAPGERSHLGLGGIRLESTREFLEVMDQGPQWVFLFSYAGHEGGQLTASRDQLQRDGWRVTVPDQVAERFRDAGLARSIY